MISNSVKTLSGGFSTFSQVQLFSVSCVTNQVSHFQSLVTADILYKHNGCVNVCISYMQ